jgi:hypothetical protein
VPDELRGRHITHLRVADSGDRTEGERRIDRLRRLGPRVVDTVRLMPYADVGTIHHEPTDVPVPAFDRNLLLSGLDHNAAAVVAWHAGPSAGAPFLVEARAWGGALSRPPAVPNAVAGRDAAFSFLAISDPSADSRIRRDALLDAMAPWSTGSSYLNFAGVEDSKAEAVRRLYDPSDFARLQDVKAAYDPANTFRINFNIPPRRRSS